MKKKRYTEEQSVYALRQVEAGVPISEQCRKMGISQVSFYAWKKKYAVFGVAELRRLRLLEDENRKLKQIGADLSLDKHMLQDVIAEKL